MTRCDCPEAAVVDLRPPAAEREERREADPVCRARLEDCGFVALRDVNLMVMTSGRKRTSEELRDLLARAQFTTSRVIATETEFGIIEAITTEEGDHR